LVSLSIALFGLNNSALAQAPDQSQKILLLHDSNAVGVWRQEFNNALHEYLVAETDILAPVRLDVEYLGLGLEQDDARLEAVIDMLKQEQLIDPASLLIGVLNATAVFVETYGNEIYPDVPRVYLNADKQQLEVGGLLADTEINANFVSSELSASIADTIEIIPQILPQYENLTVIVGSGSYDRPYLEAAREVLQDSALFQNVEYLIGTPINQLEQQLQNLTANTAVLLLRYVSDVDGQQYTAPAVMEVVNRNVDAPVFSVYDTILGRGIVGGNMARAVLSAQNVGDISLALLQGASGVDTTLARNYYFDANQLDRWDISRALLPMESVIEFDDESLWDAYGSWILLAELIMLIQAFSIIALYNSLKRQRTAEQALKEKATDLGLQKNLFESVINSIPDAIVISDVNRNIYASNKSIETVFGYAAKEFLGKKVSDFFNPEAKQENSKALMSISLDGSVDPVIMSYVKRDGEVFAGETVNTEVISSQGEVLGYFSLIRDVTQRLSREEESQRSQKMEALGNLVGGIAHDFNNVLGVISGHAEVSKNATDSSHQQESMNKIVAATKRGSEICGQIMSFSRDMSVEHTEVNLLDVVKDTLQLLNASMGNGVQVQLEAYGDCFPVYVNYTQIQQVIMNLANNASNSIGNDSGLVVISLTNDQPTHDLSLSHGNIGPGSYIVMEVKDSGCGINQQDQERIFEPFFTTRTNQGGTGMGLAIVYKLVHSHGGVIDLLSEPDRGTRIRIYFPALDQGQLAATEHSEARVLRGNGERILLVDDESDLLESMKQLLSSIGYQVEAFSDAGEALDCFQRNPVEFDLLISDQSMPRMQGTRLTQFMREIRSDLPVILCTGYSDHLDQSSQNPLALNAVMRKPFTLAEISQTIGETLETQQ